MDENAQELYGEEWTAERAFADIVSAIDNPEDFTDQINAVQSAFNTTNTEEESYKKRYEKLREDYRRRFLGEMESDVTPGKYEEDTYEKKKDLTVNDLDFNGLTE